MTQLATPRSTSTGRSAFESDSLEVLGKLRAAIAVVIGALPGKIDTAVEIDRILRVGNTPAWQLYRMTTENDPLATGRHVPGEAPMQRFFSAAAKQGIPANLIEAAERAYDEFLMLVRTHAASRRTFDTMIGGLTRSGGGFVGVQERRAAFRANSHIWGTQAKAVLWSVIVHPGSEPGTCDVASLRGYVDLCRLRPDVEFVIATFGTKGADAQSPTPEAVDLAIAGAMTGLLREFCSKPLPEIHTRMLQDGRLSIELPAGPIGSTTAGTYFMADATYGHRLRGSDEPHGEFNNAAMCKTPVETFVYDLMIYDDMCGSINPEAFVCNCPERAPGAPLDWSTIPRLPIRSEVTWVGRGPAAAQSSAIPRYPEMFAHVCRKLSWDAEKFDIYRCQVEYPVLHSTQVLRFDMPESVG